MREETYDVIVVGAGAAGLAALRDLRRAGLHVLCLEARDRIGGRILTVHDPHSPIPVELGPEFVHGHPPQSLELIARGRLAIYDSNENSVQIRAGKPLEQAESWDQIAAVTEDMKKVEERGEDPTFLDFLAAQKYPEAVKQLATNFVEGFNAARKEDVSVASLARDARAAEAIGSNSNFRILNGYDALVRVLAADYPESVRLNRIVECIDWQSAQVTVKTRSALSGGYQKFIASAAVITIPLGVLQADAVRFAPEPENVLSAAKALRFGNVNRVVMRFREAWWARIEHLKDAGFWLSDERYFPTWWTTLPVRAPLLTGWSSGPHSDELIEADRGGIVAAALDDLAKVAGTARGPIEEQLAAVHFHDWRNDPFARGAYSYVPAGALEDREILAQPVEGTLFFAGEATDLEGHSATVHGAMASGQRAARQVLSTLTKLS